LHQTQGENWTTSFCRPYRHVGGATAKVIEYFEKVVSVDENRVRPPSVHFEI
jgi:hypothetical protein